MTGALVYMIGLPYNRITTVCPRRRGRRRLGELHFKPRASSPIVHGGSLVVFVRARTPQGSLAGSSTRRLVQLNITTP